MSSILKALKKLEQEKSGRFPDSLKIDSDILRTVDSSRSFSPLALVLLLLLVFGGGAAVAIFLMKEPKALQVSTASSPELTVKNGPHPLQPAPVTPETLPAAIAVVPARPKPSGVLLRKQQKNTAGAGKKARSSVNPVRSAVAEKPVLTAESNAAVLPAVSNAPALRVNGIAFQNSAADSVAIVNGAPVTRGSIIEGVTVEEVRKDRVLFQRNGEKFEIQLGQSNR